MREIVKVVVFALGILALIIFIFLDKLADSFSGTSERVDIISRDKKSILYIKMHNWGPGADKQLTVITDDDDSEIKADSTREFIFEGLQTFLFKQSGDTLYLYVIRPVQIPNDFKSEIKVKQVVVSENTMRALRHDPEYGRL